MKYSAGYASVVNKGTSYTFWAKDFLMLWQKKDNAQTAYKQMGYYEC